jgi:hypothetical protein
MVSLESYAVRRLGNSCYAPISFDFHGQFEGAVPSKIRPSRSQNVVGSQYGISDDGCDLRYVIHSPSVNEGVRQYMLSHGDYILGRTGSRNDEYFAGLLAEQILRITAKEFLRRVTPVVGVSSYKDLVRNGHDWSNDEFEVRFVSRNNLEIVEQETRRVRAEYDGVLTYQQQNQNGIIICESKTGGLEHLACGSIGQKKLVTQRLINPVASVFVGYTPSLFLMTPQKDMFTNVAKRTLKKPLCQLHDHLAEHGWSLFVMPFSESRSDFLTLGKQINTLRSSFSQLHHVTSEKPIRYGMYVHDERTRYIVDIESSSILEIQELVSDDLWKTIFKKRRKVL